METGFDTVVEHKVSIISYSISIEMSAYFSCSHVDSSRRREIYVQSDVLLLCDDRILMILSQNVASGGQLQTFG